MKFNKNLFNLKKPLLVGICNFTPDSFSDGGKTFSRTSALNHINSMVKDGAQIIDIGAESTRPNSEPITYKEEIRRLSKILPYLPFHFGLKAFHQNNQMTLFYIRKMDLFPL